MCLILFAHNAHPKYKLIVAANRDEFYARRTAQAHYWEDQPHILAGRDLEKMGTWMGVTKNGRFSAITNYRDPLENSDGKQSRGQLVADFLKGTDPPESYMNKIARSRTSYPGYNLLAGDANELYYYSNIEDKVHRLEPGIYGVSNHLLNTDWPKVKRGKEGLSNIVKENKGDLVNQLLALLQNADPAPDEILPNTGVSRDLERTLSPMFIKSDGYGTRSSTVLLLTDEEIQYTERVFSKEAVNDQQFVFTL